MQSWITVTEKTKDLIEKEAASRGILVADLVKEMLDNYNEKRYNNSIVVRETLKKWIR